MRTVLRLGLLTIVLLQTTSIVFGQTPAKSDKPPLTTISGKVTIKDKPAQGVVVTIRRSDVYTNQSDSLPRGTTTVDGSYHIDGVPAGSFEVAPSAPAYVPAAGNRIKTVVVGQGEAVENIDFALVRGGVITGKILDADGRPIIGQYVNLFRAESFEQPKTTPQRPQPPRPNPIYQVAAATTDDRGIYRMFGLTAGRYKVAVGRGDETMSTPSVPGRFTYTQVFHPDATDQAKANIIDVSEGGEATNIDITLGRPIATYTASGRVIDGETSAPMPGMRFGLQRVKAERMEYVSSMAITNAQGEFIVEGLTAGKYSAFVLQGANSELRADSLTFEVFEQDVTGLIIRMIKGASISGVVMVENDNKSAAAQLINRQVQAFIQSPNNLSGLGQGSTAKIAPDGTFRITGLPAGTAHVAVGNQQASDNSKGFLLLRVERDGVVQPRGFEIREGEQVGGIRVVVAFGSATLRGVIKVNGTLPENPSFYIRVTRGGEQLMNMRPPRVDARGHFFIEGLPPGEYEVAASVTTQPGRPFRPTQHLVQLQEGTVTEIEITVELATTPAKP